MNNYKIKFNTNRFRIVNAFLYTIICLSIQLLVLLKPQNRKQKNNKNVKYVG